MMTYQVQVEDQMSILMDLLKIPQEKRSFLELKVRMEKVIEENRCADCLNTINQYKNADSESKQVNEEDENSEDQSKMDVSQGMAKLSAMMNILNNPGLVHLAENIFWNLDVNSLKICAQINQCCNQILKNPIFCLRKFEHISKENQKDWINAI